MHQYFQQSTQPFAAMDLYHLVCNIADYPKFLPWCRHAVIIATEPRLIIADLRIQYKIFSETFRSEVTLDPGRAVTIRSHSQPFKHCLGEWQFIDTKSPGQKDRGLVECQVSFGIELDFKVPGMNLIMQVLGKDIAKMIMNQFIKRAEVVYGKS